MLIFQGFSVEGQENIQEILSKQLYLCQCLAALMLVRTGGNFVVKLFDVFTLFSVSLIYMMYRCFEKGKKKINISTFSYTINFHTFYFFLFTNQLPQAKLLLLQLFQQGFHINKLFQCLFTSRLLQGLLIRRDIWCVSGRGWARNQWSNIYSQ